MFGDPNMEIRKDNPKARASFRARHKCSTAKDKTSARYWSCKMWQEIMAKKKQVWDKKRPKSLGKSKKLTAAQKAKAKARAKKAGRKYPNLVDNMWAANQ